MDSTCENQQFTPEDIDNFTKYNCSFCEDIYFIQDLFMCNTCSKKVCNSCSTSNCKWIHITDDCDFCYYFLSDNKQFLSHTLYFVCSSDCEHLFTSSYY